MSTTKRLSRRPLWLAVACVSVSVALCIPVLLRLNTDDAFAYALIGYILTPFVASGLLIWSRRSDLRLGAQVGYARADARRTLRTLTIVVALSYVPALVHIWYIASYVGSALS